MNLHYLYYDYAIVNVPGLVNVCKVYIPDVDVVPPLNLGAVGVGTAIITTPLPPLYPAFVPAPPPPPSPFEPGFGGPARSLLPPPPIPPVPARAGLEKEVPPPPPA
jgi:hypothetical protein